MCFFFVSRRLHEAEEASSSSSSINDMKVPFSVWKWLYHEVDLPKPEPNDALYVLGVAGLASKRLLQKHHLPTATAAEEVVRTIDVAAVPAVSQNPLARLFVLRQRLVAWQRAQLAVAAHWIQRHHPVRALWTWAGGRQTLTRTLSLAVCLVLLAAKLVSLVVTHDPTNSP